jgi:hypothetical protein
MNENNQFQLDVDTEVEQISGLINVDTASPKNLIKIMADIGLPETVYLTPTEMLAAKDVRPDFAMSQLNLSVKIDAEQAYAKAEETERQLKMIMQGMQELSDGIQSPWLENRNKDDFEERPTTEPTNLIFEARRDKMSMHPKWS